MIQKNCIICNQNAGTIDITDQIIWQNEDWLLRHHKEPFPLKGWLLLQPKRHVQGVAYFNQKEASEFGNLTRLICLELQTILTISKVYMIAFGESIDHMHVHFIPRYPSLPSKFLGFGIADLYRRIANCDIGGASKNDVSILIEELKERFKNKPPI